MKIQDIDHGMVFDHLELGTGSRVFSVLKERVWSQRFYPIMAGSFTSKREGKKDIAKLHGLHLAEGSQALNEIALLSPQATINWIENSNVAKKKKAVDCLSKEVATRLVSCANTNCISHEEAPPRFSVVAKEPLTFLCRYCTREFSRI